jgi:hypothetical protein
MNNTRTLALLAVLTAATLVVGTLAATTTIATQSAFAGGGKKDKEDKFMKMKEKDKQDTTYKKGPPRPLRQDNNNKAQDNGYNKDDGSGGNGNGNTVTIQVNKQKGKQSGWDNTQSQEAQNVICTHPGNNATCSQEGVAAPTPQPIPTTQVSGQGEGEDLCPPPATVSDPASITFSAREFAGGVQGQFTLIVHQAPNEDRNKIGTLNDIQISGGSFTVTGTELSRTACNAIPFPGPTSVTISGQCGTGVTIQFTSGEGQRATFIGNVACSTT